MNSLVVALLAFGAVALSLPFDERIVGGKDAAEGQFPYQVSLRIYKQHFCGGSILNDKWILTAAHCLKGQTEGYPKTVVTGTNSRTNGGDSYDVVKEIVHKSYANNKNDIALVKVAGPIKFNGKVRPIEMQNGPVNAGSPLVLSGWGKLGANLNPPERLQYINLRAISNEECDQSWNIDKTQICSYTKPGEGGCMGDSGGPLAYNGKVAGVVSYGRPCADGKPDVYTRVSEYINWVNENMSKN